MKPRINNRFVQRMGALLLLTLAATILCRHGWASPLAPPSPRQQDEFVFGFVRVFQAVLGVKGNDLGRIETGSRDRARQRAAARREGIPLTPREFQRPLPSAELNAAPVYVQLTRLLKEKPLDPKLEVPTSGLGTRYHYDADDVTAARRLLAERQDVMTLIRQATDRPCCDFRRDWSLGPALVFPEYAPARSAARLLRAESFLLALDGRYEEAVANQARGFRIAAHIAPDGVLIAYLTGMACEAITLAGMEDLLYQAGQEAGIAEQVRMAIAAYPPSYSLRHVLEGELVYDLATMDELRRIGVRSVFFLAGKDPASDPKLEKQLTEVEKSPQIEHFWKLWVDAGEADILQRMRCALAITERPYPAQKRFFRAWQKAVDTPSLGLVDFFRLELLPVFDLASAKEVQLHAQERVLIAGAAVLAYRAKRGRWPERLIEAMSWPPADPFSGRPLCYRREGDGFVVYSVGSEGRYHGGRPGVPRDPVQAVFRYPAPPRRERPASGGLPLLPMPHPPEQPSAAPGG